MNFRQYVFDAPYFGWLGNGLLMTLLIAFVSSVLAAVIGFLVLRCHMSTNLWLRGVGIGFVTLFRNVPLVPLLLFLTFGIPGLWTHLWGLPFPQGFEFPLLLLGLALNTAAYFGEILFAGVAAVPTDQVYAARTLGLSLGAVRRQVLYPQAVRIVAPALASRFIHNMKNSTLALVVPLQVGMMEIVGQAGRIAGQTFSWAEPLIAAAFVHFLLAIGLGWLLNHWANREQSRIEATA